MVELVLGLLGSTLSLWESKEKTKYIDKYIKLQREYYNEVNKEIFDDAVLDNINFELRLLGEALNSAIAKTNSET